MMRKAILEASHQRSVATIIKAMFKYSHAVALWNMFRLCDRPVDFLKRYITRRGGAYPDQYSINTPTGPINVKVFCPDDIMTVNEIFFRNDYEINTDGHVIVDFGSNVGISTLYWLSRNAKNFAYCFEPLKNNIELFRKNLFGYEARYELNTVAVGLANGEVEFGWEATGRYGGVGKKTGQTMLVPCVDSNAQLERIVRKHGRINVLKIDIEMLEQELTDRIPPSVISNIDLILVEKQFPSNSHAKTHQMSFRAPITRFSIKSL